MSIADKLVTIAENEQRVYEKGMSDSELDFWNSFTNAGNRQNYYYGFQNTNFSGKTIPKGLCKPRQRISSMFYQCYGTSLPLGVDCSEFNTSLAEANHASLMFAFSTSLVEIYDMGLPVQKTYDSFARGCTNLVTIAVMRSDENTVWTTNTFNGCTALENLTIEGKIGKNNFNVSACEKLTHDSLMSIINALADKTTDTSGTIWKVTLGNTNIAKLTDDEIGIIIARGWQFA